MFGFSSEQHFKLADGRLEITAVHQGLSKHHQGLWIVSSEAKAFISVSHRFSENIRASSTGQNQSTGEKMMGISVASIHFNSSARPLQHLFILSRGFCSVSQLQQWRRQITQIIDLITLGIADSWYGN